MVLAAIGGILFCFKESKQFYDEGKVEWDCNFVIAMIAEAKMRIEQTAWRLERQNDPALLFGKCRNAAEPQHRSSLQKCKNRAALKNFESAALVEPGRIKSNNFIKSLKQIEHLIS